MINVSNIAAPRRALDWYSSTQVDERATEGQYLPADRVTLSAEARGALEQVGGASESGDGHAQEDGSKQAGAQPGAAKEPGGQAGQARGAAGGVRGLTPEQQRQVQDLQARDTHVRSHEAAHQAAGGDLTGPASFSYEQGPDGRSYAVGGEVPIQSRAGRTPDETISIARRVRAAALAPSDPSAADLAAASAASQVELRAMQQKRDLSKDGAAGGAGAARPAQAARAGAGPRQAERAGQAGGQAKAEPAAAAQPGKAPADVVAAAPISTPQANLERLIVRAPEASNPF